MLVIQKDITSNSNAVSAYNYVSLVRITSIPQKEKIPFVCLHRKHLSSKSSNFL